MRGTPGGPKGEKMEEVIVETPEVKPEVKPDVKVDDWRMSLPPEIKDHAVLKKYETPNDAIKALVDVQPLIGLDKLPIPPKDAKPEVREKFLNEAFDRLGRPKDPKEYKLSELKDVKVNPEVLDALKAEAHKLGLLPAQLDGLYKWYASDIGMRMKQHEEGLTKAKQDSEAALRKEWGEAYNGKVLQAQSLLNKFSGDDYKSLLDSGFGNHPAVVRFMANMADKLGEDALAKGSTETTLTPKEAAAELAKVRGQILSMTNKNDPEYKLLLQRREELMAMATPE
jgi:hypothetical protein